MSKYLAFSDLDDTLLTKNKRITLRTKLFLRSFAKKGNYFVICTGRPYAGCINFYNYLGLKMPLVTDNGAAIYYPNKKVKTFGVPLEKYLSYLKDTDGLTEGIYCTTSTNIAYLENRKIIPGWLIHNELNDLKIIEGKVLENAKHEPLIINTWVKEENFDKYMRVLNSYSDAISYRNWGLNNGVYSFELFSTLASKGQALRFLQKELCIDDDKTMAFGDQYNDLSMIKEAHYGVAMINAVEDLKKETIYFTTSDFNHNGVIKFIKKNKLF